MRKPTTTLGAAFLTIALLTSGCGGDDGGDDKSSDDTSKTSEPTSDAPDDETDAPSTGISKEEFITAADALCTAGNDTLNAAQAALPDQSDETLTAFVVDAVIPTLSGTADGIEALGAPEGDEEAVAEILSSLRTGIEDLEADPSLLVNGDPLAESTQLAADYGLEVCGA